MMGASRSLEKLANASGYRFFFINQRGDSGQKKMPQRIGIAGMQAEPS